MALSSADFFQIWIWAVMGVFSHLDLGGSPVPDIDGLQLIIHQVAFVVQLSDIVARWRVPQHRHSPGHR